MGKIVVSETASVDGVIQDPVGQAGFRFAGWFDRVAGKDREAWAKVEFEEALAASALLMGRRTYEWLVAGGWPSRGGDWADRLRALPKYVVSTTLDTFDWANSTVLKGDVVDEVAKLRDTVDGDIVLYGSGVLAHTLLKHGLVDELRLTICPFVLGDGQRVFGDTGDIEPMRLVDSQPVGESMVRLTYQGLRRAS